MKYKSIKCSYNICMNEAVGYFVTSSSGLFLCKEHSGSSTPKTTIGEMRKNPDDTWHFTDDFEDGKYIKPEPKYDYNGRKEVKEFIDKEICKATYRCAISSVDGNIFLSSFYEDMEKKVGELSDNERGYAEFRFWLFQPYTNWSGD